MAEIAAGALVVEQIVSTGVEAAAAATVAKPTQLIRASLSQFAATPADDSSLMLARSRHTVTVIGNKGYIFGGEREGGQLCGTDIHAIAVPSGELSNDIEYACYPSVPDRPSPPPRTGHAACSRHASLIIHGGREEHGNPVEDGSVLWIWDSERREWTQIDGAGEAPTSRSDHRIFFSEKHDALILHGGKTRRSEEDLEPGSSETWLFDFNIAAWNRLPPAPGPPLNAAFVNETLYSISSESDVSGFIHFLKLDKPLAWSTVDAPTSPLTPGPRPRFGSGLVPITTGYGRYYLIYFFGSRKGTILASTTHNEKDLFYADMWSLQIPSSGLSGSAVKDTIRDGVPGIDSGAFTWSEMQITPTEPKQADGKAHPGPRGFFGADLSADGKSVVFWGGINAKGETESDGWLLSLT
ncbi:hypothetical protein EDB81DRAFT_836950 [Dactylonectria macrodidyma]|uniref:Uncharacterized protein n=1 Tax=Dactylonectria macrodidyma TaxID=307937 RepID=A0A9P9JG48_9HYPO|nr:hypothetical protein EDB81DRAFT_836950 [Dactylonectria macrodidyma]